MQKPDPTGAKEFEEPHGGYFVWVKARLLHRGLGFRAFRV